MNFDCYLSGSFQVNSSFLPRFSGGKMLFCCYPVNSDDGGDDGEDGHGAEEEHIA